MIRLVVIAGIAVAPSSAPPGGRMVVDMKIELERPRVQEMRRSSELFKSYYHEMSDRLRSEVELAELRLNDEK